MALAETPNVSIAGTHRSRLESSSAAWLISLPIAFTGAFFVFPFIYMIRMSLNRSSGGLNFESAFVASNYTEFLGDSYYLQAFGKTFLLAAIVTVVNLFLAYPVAYAIARAGRSVKALLVFLILIAMWIPLVVRIYGLIIALDQAGPIDDLLSFFGIQLELINTVPGVVLGLVNLTLPWMVLALAASMWGIDSNLELAARAMGASRARAFLEVIVPLTIPGAVAGAILVFTWAVGEYAVPVLIGGGSITVMSQLISDAYFQAVNWPLAAAMSIIMLVPVAVVTGVMSRWMRERY